MFLLKKAVSPLLGLFALLPIFPARILARRLLWADLLAYGVNPASLPQRCVEELVDNIITMAKFEATMKRGGFRYRLVFWAEGTAIQVSQYTYGDDEEHTVEGVKRELKRGMNLVVWGILSKNDSDAFGLSNLETIQASNRKLRDSSAFNNNLPVTSRRSQADGATITPANTDFVNELADKTGMSAASLDKLIAVTKKAFPKVSNEEIERMALEAWREKQQNLKLAQKGADNQVEIIFAKVKIFLNDDDVQNQRLSPEIKDKVLNGVSCDQFQNGRGEFGKNPNNPIPVNGPVGEIIYLSRLRTGTGIPLMFQRIGSLEAEVGIVDRYQVLSIDGKVNTLLYLSLVHPRKSTRAPENYILDKGLHPKNPIFGVNFSVDNFPLRLDEHIRHWQKSVLNVPLPVDLVRGYLSLPSVTPSPLPPIDVELRKRSERNHYGLCTRCFKMKEVFPETCPYCGKRLQTENDMIISIFLSSNYHDRESLEDLSNSLTSGKALSLKPEDIEAIRPTARVLLQTINGL